jgi:hypothetical protein
MKWLVRLRRAIAAGCDGLREQESVVQGFPQPLGSLEVHPQVRHDSLISDDACSRTGEKPIDGQRDVNNMIEVATRKHVFEIDHSRVGAGDPGDLSLRTGYNFNPSQASGSRAFSYPLSQIGSDWQWNVGLLGHDGKPRFYDSKTGEWTRSTPEPLPAEPEPGEGPAST